MSKKNVRNPITTPQRKRVWRSDGQPFNVPVTPAVASALQQFNQRHTKELRKLLAPFGLHVYDIALPVWERVVYEDEINGGVS